MFVAASRAYQRRTETGWESVHLALIDHPVDFDAVVDTEIRFDKIQELIIHEGDRHHRTATIGCEYGNLIGTGQHRWSIASEGDVSYAARDIMRASLAALFPFFQEYCDLATVYETLRTNGAVARLLMPLDDKRQTIVEAAASLLQMPE